MGSASKTMASVRNPQIDFGSSCVVANHCDDFMVTCDSSSKFRSFDGTCNNLDSPYFGSAGIAFARYKETENVLDPLLDMTFFDTLPTTPNEAQENGCHLRKNLPNARLVSSTVHLDKDAPSLATHFTTQFGQFVDHDITFTPTEDMVNCCDNANANDVRCSPIDVSNDAAFSGRGVNCLNFIRSVQHCAEKGGMRNQVNGITSYLDGSMIYGSDSDQAEEIRTLANGELKVTERAVGETDDLLPKIDGVFTAGEHRAREVPGLALSHTLWVREHNRVAKIVATMFDSDEDIYQYTRRVVVAEYQNIVYGQYLSEILGNDDLKPTTKGSQYDPSINPAMTNEFATAAYRFGHSMVQGMTKLLTVDNPDQELKEVRLRDVFFEDDLYENAFDNLLMELIFRSSQSNDACMTSELSNHLFANKDPPMGPTDLASRNIHRGRDHGLPGFCAYYRRFQDQSHDCTQGWETKYVGIPDDTWAQMQQVYDHPSDIDLFTAGIAQENEPQSQLGKVFQGMIKDNFERAMKGDRFFFNHQESCKLQGVGFTTKAQKITHDRTMSGVICDTTTLTKVPVNVFHMDSGTIECSATARMDQAEIKELIKFL